MLPGHGYEEPLRQLCGAPVRAGSASGRVYAFVQNLPQFYSTLSLVDKVAAGKVYTQYQL